VEKNLLGKIKKFLQKTSWVASLAFFEGEKKSLFQRWHASLAFKESTAWLAFKESNPNNPLIEYLLFNHF
jgi:hypothetical protein